jgi:hypothetical protein
VEKSILITWASSGIGGQSRNVLQPTVLSDITTEVREGGVPAIDLQQAQGCDGEIDDKRLSG